MKVLSGLEIVFDNRPVNDHFRNIPTQKFVILIHCQRSAGAAFGKSGASVRGPSHSEYVTIHQSQTIKVRLKQQLNSKCGHPKQQA